MQVIYHEGRSANGRQWPPSVRVFIKAKFCAVFVNEGVKQNCPTTKNELVTN